MAAPVKKLGTGGGVKTGVTTEIADKHGKTFTFEGTVAELESMSMTGKIPDGFVPVRSVLSPTGGGMGILTVSCVKYEATTPTSRARQWKSLTPRLSSSARRIWRG